MLSEGPKCSWVHGGQSRFPAKDRAGFGPWTSCAAGMAHPWQPGAAAAWAIQGGLQSLRVQLEAAVKHDAAVAGDCSSGGRGRPLAAARHSVPSTATAAAFGSTDFRGGGSAGPRALRRLGASLRSLWECVRPGAANTTGTDGGAMAGARWQGSVPPTLVRQTRASQGGLPSHPPPVAPGRRLGRSGLWLGATATWAPPHCGALASRPPLRPLGAR